MPGLPGWKLVVLATPLPTFDAGVDTIHLSWQLGGRFKMER